MNSPQTSTIAESWTVEFRHGAFIVRPLAEYLRDAEDQAWRTLQGEPAPDGKPVHQSFLLLWFPSQRAAEFAAHAMKDAMPPVVAEHPGLFDPDMINKENWQAAHKAMTAAVARISEEARMFAASLESRDALEKPPAKR